MITWLLDNIYYKDLETAQKNFAYWTEWQQKQPSNHFVDCNLTSYIPVKRGLNSIPIKYCFGCFSNLIYKPEDCDVFAYINSLLTIYDNCKGYSRMMIKGDNAGIALLRKIVKDKKLDELYQHNFQLYNYNYKVLHGHTVGYFSLSTLIMFFLSNYMYYYSSNLDYFPFIDQEICKDIYQAKVFGELCFINQVTKSNSIGIVKKIDKIDKRTNNVHSWPSIANFANATVKCQACNRVAESLWNEKHCLDCHLYKVCHCGGQPFTTNKDGYPVCILHKNMS